MEQETRLFVCPKCGKLAWVMNMEAHGAHGDYFYCPYCGGRGKVPEGSIIYKDLAEKEQMDRDEAVKAAEQAIADYYDAVQSDKGEEVSIQEEDKTEIPSEDEKEK